MPDPSEWEFEYNGLVFGAATDYGIRSIEGLSRPDSREDVLTRAGEHGAYVFGQFLPERRITIEGDIRGTPGTDFSDKVETFREKFVPILEPFPLRYRIAGEAQIRRIYSVPVRGAFMIDPMYSIGYAEWVLQFLAPDPRIYSDEENIITVGTSGGSNGMSFDEVFDMTFGGGAAGVTGAENAGVFNSPPFLRLAGPATNPVIRNVTANKELRFNPLTLTASEYIDIDTNKRTIYLNGDSLQSRYFTLEQISEWWYLDPGLNSLQVTTGGDTPSLTVRWRDAWI